MDRSNVPRNSISLAPICRKQLASTALLIASRSLFVLLLLLRTLLLLLSLPLPISVCVAVFSASNALITCSNRFQLLGNSQLALQLLPLKICTSLCFCTLNGLVEGLYIRIVEYCFHRWYQTGP